MLACFNEGLKRILKQSTVSCDFESKEILMAKLVKIMKQELLDWNSFHFSGSFASRKLSTTYFKKIVSMLLNGPYVQHLDDHESQACLTISQLVSINIKSRKVSSQNSRHFKDRETSLPLYLGLNIHTQKRSKIKLVNYLHQLSISISYSHVVELENCLASSICARFEEDSLLCPSHL